MAEHPHPDGGGSPDPREENLEQSIQALYTETRERALAEVHRLAQLTS
jgi:hypothetical protein